MKKLTRYHKRIKLTYAVAAFLCCFLLLFLFNTSSFASGLDYYIVKIGEETVGTSNNRETAEQALADARIRLSKEADSIVYVDSKFTIEKEKRAFAKTEQPEELADTIYTKLKEYTNLNYVQAIMLSSGSYSLTVDSQMTANRVLQALLNRYDTEDEYDVRLNTQKDGSFTGMTYELYDSLLMEQLGADINLGIDRHLLEKAKENQKPILEIESAASQYQLLAGFSDELQAWLLESSVEMCQSPDLARIDMNLMMDLWASGNEQAFSAYLAGSDETMTDEEQALYEEFNQAMLTNRNLQMAEFARDALLSGEEIFICVGAAHVIGEGSITQLLAQQGYTVEQVAS